jgi:two-component sensor histidine kinase
MAEHIHDVAIHLFQTYSVSPQVVNLEFNAEKIFLDINSAVPLGLVVSELVSNALKHAIVPDKKINLQIKFIREKDDRINLTVSDDGRGIPDGIDINNPKTLGIQLVNDLVKQIDGQISVKRKPGTTFIINFPLSE